MSDKHNENTDQSRAFDHTFLKWWFGELEGSICLKAEYPGRADPSKTFFQLDDLKTMDEFITRYQNERANIHLSNAVYTRQDDNTYKPVSFPGLFTEVAWLNVSPSKLAAKLGDSFSPNARMNLKQFVYLFWKLDTPFVQKDFRKVTQLHRELFHFFNGRSLAPILDRLPLPGSIDFTCDPPGRVGVRVLPDCALYSHAEFFDYFGAALREPARKGGIQLNATTMANIKPEDVDWVWEDKFARGTINLLAGDPQRGKSFLIADLCGRITRGTPFPDGAPCCKGSVVVVGGEDNRAQTFRPRLDAQGADPDKVHVFDPTKEESPIQFDIGRDLPELETLIESIGDVALVVFDPLSAYLGNTETFKDNRVRAVLTPLAEMAKRTNVAIIAIMHFNKRQELKSLYRIGGSIAFMAQARMSWVIIDDPKDPERRLFLKHKGNITGTNLPGLAFGFEPLENDPKRARLVWEPEPIEISLEAAISGEQLKRGPKPDRMQAALALLDKFLANGDSVPAKTIEAAAADLNISSSTLNRACQQRGVEPRKEGFGMESAWHWTYPKEANQRSEAQKETGKDNSAD